MIKRFNDQRRSDHDEAGDQYYEDSGSVAGIGETIIKSACVAVWPQR